MKCPDSNCNHNESRVVRSKSAMGGFGVKKVRECLICSKRFISYELHFNDLINPKKIEKSYEYISEEKTNEFLKGLM